MWWTRRAQQNIKEQAQILKQKALSYPLIGDNVSGLTVLDNVPNTSSISASFEDYEILPGIREVPISQFDSAPNQLFYTVNDYDRTQNLAERIGYSGTISPLIVVVDKEETPYILEGAHRLGALHTLGIQTFPALIVIDYDSLEKDKQE